MDNKSKQLLASMKLGTPSALALATNAQRLFVIARSGEEVPHSVHMVNVSVPSAPKIETSIPVGKASGIAVSSSRLFVSDGGRDSIIVIDTETNRLLEEIPIRIPGLETLRGVQPAGLAWHEKTGSLLVAEPEINAIGVIDVHQSRVLGHIPTAWRPMHVAVHENTIFVACARGHGSGQYAGTFSAFPMPPPSELAAMTTQVMEMNGLRPRPVEPSPLPDGVKHVVMIVKGNRTYDELMGDLAGASNGPAMGNRALARFGASGFADGRGVRLSIKGATIAPNHRAIAQRWSFGDNFYADGFPATGAIWRHLAANGVSFLNFGEFPSANTAIADQARTTQFIADLDNKYVKAGVELPQFLFIHLPNDRMAPVRPADGYPYEESFVADNDYALGRVLEFLSGTKWWKHMAVMITEAGADGGMDHVDPHRTVLYCAGPWAKRNYVTHANTSFAGLWKTVFRFLKLPPMGLADAVATDLAGCFTAQPDASPYKAVPVDPRIFDPAPTPPQ
jgi:hypothetical protein